MLKIDPKYRIDIQGVYNKGIDICPYCGNKYWVFKELFNHCKGIASSDHGDMLVIECDKCFETFYFHSYDLYKYFIEAVDAGTNIFYK